MIEAHLDDADMGKPMDDDIRPLQEDMDFSGEFIHSGKLRRIWPKPAVEFDPRVYWGVGTDEYREQYARALRDQRQVRGLNADTIEQNKRIALHNKHIEGMNKVLKGKDKIKPTPPIPMPYRVSKENAAILGRERQANDVLRRRSPVDWEYQPCRFEGGLKDAVARIIWWDWFSQRPFGKRWDELDEHLNERVRPMDKDDLAEALMRCGYTPVQAWKRVG